MWTHVLEKEQKDDFSSTSRHWPPCFDSPPWKTPVDRVSRGQGTHLRASAHTCQLYPISRSRDRSPYSFLQLSFQRLRAIVSWINGTRWTAVYEPSQEYRDPRELFTRNGSNPARKLTW